MDESKSQAMRNLVDSVDLTNEIPHRVLALQYTEFYVMDFQRLIRNDTVNLLHTIMRFERSTTTVIATFTEIARTETDWRSNCFFVTESTNPIDYWSFIRANLFEFSQPHPPSNLRAPWWVFAKTIGACSELGTWCIYGDKFAEIALVGFKTNLGDMLAKRLRATFGIERLEDALQRDTFFGEPGNEYSMKRRSTLRGAYIRH
jgi:hypothetical protein